MRLTQTAREHHLAELARLSHHATRRSKSQRAQLNFFRSYIFYVKRALSQWLEYAWESRGELLVNPLSYLSSLVLFPVIWVLLAFLVGAFWLGGQLGLSYIIPAVAKKYAKSLSFVNWANPDIFGEESVEIMRQAARELGQLPVNTGSLSIFSQPIAKTALILSALVYERIDAEVRQAAEVAKTNVSKAELLLEHSEKLIRDTAEKWDMDFVGVSDLASVGGAFASIFSPKPDEKDTVAPWIMIVFKGTTPDDFAEFLVDATISKVDSSQYLGPGLVHQGFYESLFGVEGGSPGGYGAILVVMTELARKMHLRKGHTGGPIPIWISGHSLGSALASLLHARFVYAPQDLVDKATGLPLMQLCQTYSYGTPSLGSSQFLSSVAFANSTASAKGATAPVLYRVVDDKDIVCRVPVGDETGTSINHRLSQSSVFNYGHAGWQIILRESMVSTMQWRSADGAESRGVQVVGAQAYPNSAPWEDNILQKALGYIPAFGYDHFPARYLLRLSNMEDGTQ